MRKRCFVLAACMMAALCMGITGCQSENKQESTDIENTTTDEGNELPQMPYGIKISEISDEGISVYWKKTEYAKGYEVYRSYKKNGEYELIYEAKRNEGLYTDADFDHEKTKVYYRLRSFEYDENDEKIYSEYTEVLTAKYRNKMKLSKSTIYMPSGISRVIESYYGWGNTKDVVWSSSDENIAAVEQDGTVTAYNTGNCMITCTSEALETELTCNIIVNRENPEPLTEITSRYTKQESGFWKNLNAQETEDAVIMMTGDMMCPIITTVMQVKMV